MSAQMPRRESDNPNWGGARPGAGKPAIKVIGPDGREWRSVYAAAKALGCNRGTLKHHGDPTSPAGTLRLLRYPGGGDATP